MSKRVCREKVAGIWSENTGLTMELLFSVLLSSSALFSIDLMIKSIDSSFEGVLLFSTVRKKERERERKRLGFGDFVDFEVLEDFLSCFGYFFCEGGIWRTGWPQHFSVDWQIPVYDS